MSLASSPPNLSMSLSFSIHSLANHPSLHSFPTRRSSDLPIPRSPGSRRLRLVRRAHQLRDRRGVRERRGDLQEVVALRSEEHTSELQSPYDLVCRLLLEKKKCGETGFSCARSEAFVFVLI